MVFRKYLFLSLQCVISECIVVTLFSFVYFFRSTIFLMTSSLASSGDPFSLILQFVIQVLCIFPSFLRYSPCLALWLDVH